MLTCYICLFGSLPPERNIFLQTMIVRLYMLLLLLLLPMIKPPPFFLETSFFFLPQVWFLSKGEIINFGEIIGGKIHTDQSRWKELWSHCELEKERQGQRRKSLSEIQRLQTHIHPCLSFRILNGYLFQ